MSAKLANKVVVVTGGGSGVGRELCKRFAREGASLVIADINETAGAETANLVQTKEHPAMLAKLDVSQLDSWQALHDKVFERYGQCDVLCNNAGVFRVGGLLDAPISDWYLQSKINIDGVILGCKTFAGGMVTRGSGHIINTASLSGLLAAAELSTYTASKFAVVGFSQALRLELADKGVKVSILAPGAIDTPMNHDVDVPLEDRLIPPGDVAQAVVDAVKNGENPEFIFTHPEFYPALAEQYNNILDACRALQAQE